MNDAPMTLESLEGVGPALARRLRRRFGDDEGFLRAARERDLEAIGAVEGISEQRAVALVKTVQGAGDDAAFLATTAARKVHAHIMGLLTGYASTDPGRNRLRTLPFLPDAAQAQRSMQDVLDLRRATEGMDRDRVRSWLRRVRPLQDRGLPTAPDTLVVAADDDVRETLMAMGLGRAAALGGPQDLRDAEDYGLVVVAYGDRALDTSGVPNAVEVPVSDGVAGILPGPFLSRLQGEHAVLEALAGLAEARGEDSVTPQALTLLASTPTAAPVDAAVVRRAVEQETARLEAAVQEAAASLSLSGTDLLAALQGGSLPAALQEALEAQVALSTQALRDATGLPLDPFPARLPIQVDDDHVAQVLTEATASDQVARFHAQQRAAKRIADLLPCIGEEVASAQRFDADFALGCFASDHDLRPWRDGDRLAFTDGVHLGLAADPDAQRIAYHIGGDDNVALLTGANSGGKSTLLEHLCQILVLARMGLPVPAGDAEVPWLDELHLVTARRGLDAGAFETFLRGFLPVVQGGARRMVLVDEVEAVTELEAAARILAFTLDRLAASDSMGVIVTHLAPQVLQQAQGCAVRVDGIEATGLDDAHRLVVDRSPRLGHLARSTPELILRRLAATVQGPEGRLYEDLLASFQGQP